MDFNAILKRELAKANKFNGSTDETPSYNDRINDLVRVNSKVSFLGRILPLAETAAQMDEWWAKDFDSVFIQFPKDDGSLVNVMAEIDINNPNDKIAVLTNEAMAWNREHKDAQIKFDMNERNHFGLHVARKTEFVGVPVIKSPQGGFVMAQSQKIKGCPEIKNYQVSRAAYNGILGLLSEGYMIGGQSFPDEAQFVTLGKSFPVSIQFDKASGKAYNVNARPDIILPEVPKAVLAKDENGKFKYIDNPNDYHKPLFKSNPDFADRVAKELEKKIMAVKGANQVAVGENPIAQGQPESIADQPIGAPESPKQEAPAASPFEGGDDFGGFDTPAEPQAPTQPQTPPAPEPPAEDPFADNADEGGFDDFGSNQSFEDFLNQ